MTRGPDPRPCLSSLFCPLTLAPSHPCPPSASFSSCPQCQPPQSSQVLPDPSSVLLVLPQASSILPGPPRSLPVPPRSSSVLLGPPRSSQVLSRSSSVLPRPPQSSRILPDPPRSSSSSRVLRTLSGPALEGVASEADLPSGLFLCLTFPRGLLNGSHQASPWRSLTRKHRHSTSCGAACGGDAAHVGAVRPRLPHPRRHCPQSLCGAQPGSHP